MRRVLAGAASLAVAMIAFAPLSLARGVLEARTPGLAVESMDGTLWSGTLRNVSYGRQLLGDVQVRTSLLRLLAGQSHVHLSGGVRGNLRAGQGRLELQVERLDVPPVSMGLSEVMPSPAQISGLDLMLENGSCARASGDIQAIVRLGERTLPVSGTISCDQGRVTARFEGTQVSGTATLAAGGRVVTEITATGLDATASAQLALLGFETGEDQASLTRQGSLGQP